MTLVADTAVDLVRIQFVTTLPDTKLEALFGPIAVGAGRGRERLQPRLTSKRLNAQSRNMSIFEEIASCSATSAGVHLVGGQAFACWLVGCCVGVRW